MCSVEEIRSEWGNVDSFRYVNCDQFNLKTENLLGTLTTAAAFSLLNC